jgi:hypothetical protein
MTLIAIFTNINKNALVSIEKDNRKHILNAILRKVPSNFKLKCYDPYSKTDFDLSSFLY